MKKPKQIRAGSMAALLVLLCLAAPTDVLTGDAPSCDLEVTPEQPTLTGQNNQVVLRASGGTGNYSWTVGDVILGSLSQDTGHTVVYTRLNPNDNVVRVVSGDCTFYVVIKQP